MPGTDIPRLFPDVFRNKKIKICGDFLQLGLDKRSLHIRYKKYKYMIDQVFTSVADYKKYFEDITRRAYTIGGMIIFPKHPSSMNQNKGTNVLVSDRWDLTLECIRRWYNGENSPLYETIERGKDFYNLFVDFKGFVDFFFLQDCVSDDYSKVDIWCGNADFKESALPKALEYYFDFINKEFDFLNKRNARIKEYYM